MVSALDYSIFRDGRIYAAKTAVVSIIDQAGGTDSHQGHIQLADIFAVGNPGGGDTSEGDMTAKERALSPQESNKFADSRSNNILCRRRT